MNHYTKWSKLVKVFRMSLTRKKNNGWSREVGAGFIMEDIQEIELGERKGVLRACPTCGKGARTFPSTYAIEFFFTWGNQTMSVSELNLRETEEALKFCMKQRKKEMKP